jgi:hypothetical protein
LLSVYDFAPFACEKSAFILTGFNHEIAGCQWPKAGHILEMGGKNKFD